MMSYRLATVLAVFVFTLAAGCQQNTAPTTAPAKEPGTNIHIQTPRGKVDVQGDGNNGKTNVGVDVHPKGTGR